MRRNRGDDNDTGQYRTINITSKITPLNHSQQSRVGEQSFSCLTFNLYTQPPTSFPHIRPRHKIFSYIYEGYLKRSPEAPKKETSYHWLLADKQDLRINNPGAYHTPGGVVFLYFILYADQSTGRPSLQKLTAGFEACGIMFPFTSDPWYAHDRFQAPSYPDLGFPTYLPRMKSYINFCNAIQAHK